MHWTPFPSMELEGAAPDLSPIDSSADTGSLPVKFPN